MFMYALLTLLALLFMYDISLFIVGALAFLIIVVKLDMVEVKVKYSMKEMFADPPAAANQPTQPQPPSNYLPPDTRPPAPPPGAAQQPSPSPQRCFMRKVCKKVEYVPEKEVTMPMGKMQDDNNYEEVSSYYESDYDDSDDSTSYYADSEEEEEEDCEE
jgi:hypothetical protein